MNQPVSNSEPPEDATRRSYKACHCATEGEAAKVKVSKVKQERKRKSFTRLITAQQKERQLE